MSKCKNCVNLRYNWCEKVSDDPDENMERECVHFRHTTNDDRINYMTIEEKAEFLSKIACARETPWSKPFAEKFCASCPEPEYTLEDGSKMRLHECDFSGGVCPHGGDIVWWLQQPAEENDHDERKENENA